MPPLGIISMASVSNTMIESIPEEDQHLQHRINFDSSMRSQSLAYQSTQGGNVLVVQPSFDDPGRRTPAENVELQARSPPEASKLIDYELRHPPAGKPAAVHHGHSRNLSARFFDAATIKDKEEESVIEEKGSDGGEGRKHRRLFSDDLTSPSHLHRRLDSQGGRGPVRREGRFHQREDSAGLDMLSAVADASKEDLAAAVGSVPWLTTSVHPGETRTPSAEPFHQQAVYAMPPPSHSTRPSQSSMSSYSPYAPPYPPSHYTYPAGHHPSAYGVSHPHSSLHLSSRPSGHRPSEGHPSYHSEPSSRAQAPLEGSWRVARKTPQEGDERKPPSHQGSQTFVTAIAVGSGTKTLQASKTTKNASTNTAIGDNASIPSEIRHHRKMSSLSSFGTLLGSSLFSTAAEPERERQGHHRRASSTISFLGDFPTALDGADATFMKNLRASDAAFMKNLHASVNSEVPDFPVPNPPSAPNLSSGSGEPAAPPLHPLKVSSVPTLEKGPCNSTSPAGAGVPETESGDSLWDDSSSSKLAAGGTSKRLRRKCTVQGCQNRVVQGGLCISHGAKRKTCMHPGCTKNVKKAGLCSTHGPARKRCDQEGCTKVAVQGGRCIAHGAKKKLCVSSGCTKQAILGGMCKKHHDQAIARGDPIPRDAGETGSYCQVVKPAPKPVSHKAHHTRGLSIFQEISADAVESLLNDDPL